MLILKNSTVPHPQKVLAKNKDPYYFLVPPVRGNLKKRGLTAQPVASGAPSAPQSK